MLWWDTGLCLTLCPDMVYEISYYNLCDNETDLYHKTKGHETIIFDVCPAMF